jgi:hypothetical protein
LGYRDKEIWRMSPYQILVLYNDKLDWQGLRPKKATIDDVIPF